MSMQTQIHGSAAEVNLMRVFYRGTDTLKEGYALCFNFDALDVDAENNALTSIDVGEEFWNDARRIMVEKPAEGNKIHFAGVVSQKSNGVTGPGWVEIHRPGSICNIYAFANCDHGASGITTNTGQYVTFCPGKYYFMDGGFDGEGAATVLQDVDRSTTPGPVMAELQIGRPSCGFQVVHLLSTATAGAISVSLSVPFAHCGVYAFSGDSTDYVYPEEEATTIAAAMSQLIGGVTTNVGHYKGQRFKLIALDALSSNGLSIQFSTGVSRVAGSLGRAATSGYVDLSAGNDYIEGFWDGHEWMLDTGHEASLMIS